MTDHLILIPVWNEAPTIERIVARARRHGAVLVVDDGSSDGSGALAAKAGAEVLRLDHRHGKGGALRHGLMHAVASGSGRIVTLDGDGQHDPDEIPHLLAAAARAPEALVIGGRLPGLSGPPPRAIPPGRLNAMRVAGFFINWLTGVRLADTQSGFRIYPARLLASVDLRREGFVFETEVLVRATALGWALRETPVSAIPAGARPSRFRPIRDGMAVSAYLGGQILPRWARELSALLWGHRTPATGRRWWRAPETQRLLLVTVALAAAPVLLLLASIQIPLRRLGPDLLTPFVSRLFSQARLAPLLAPGAHAAEPQDTRRESPRSRAPEYAVLVVGGGPGGSSAATFLARGGLSVALVEREAFPRFRVGESLLPTCMLQFERLGVLDRIKTHGFQPKNGVFFHDQESQLSHTFYFRPGRPWPHYTFDVARDEMDQILLEHAAKQSGVTLFQPVGVEQARFDAEGVTALLHDGGEIRARFLVDASGREAFIASRHGRREPMPGLGTVAIFAYYRGLPRWAGRAEGNVRIYIFPEGWFWWIPLANDQTSVGCVLHSRTVRGREGSLPDLFEAMVARCDHVREGLSGAERITPIYTAANDSYRAHPVVGDRFVCVGDAAAFVDPIFSAGVFVALQSGEMAAAEILRAFAERRFEAARFAAYERRFFKGMRPFCRFIEHDYDPSFLEIFLKPKSVLGMVDGVTGVLAGGAFTSMGLRMRLSLAAFFAVVRVNRWTRRRHGLPAESRLEW